MVRRGLADDLSSAVGEDAGHVQQPGALDGVEAALLYVEHKKLGLALGQGEVLGGVQRQDGQALPQRQRRGVDGPGERRAGGDGSEAKGGLGRLGARV